MGTGALAGDLGPGFPAAAGAVGFAADPVAAGLLSTYEASTFAFAGSATFFGDSTFYAACSA